jgi:anti-anti-sigma regulatory factor
MGLQIAVRKSGTITILDLQGRIIIGASNQMDSSGISTLVRSFVTLERQGGGLKLLNPTGHVREVLELTRLIQSIPTFTDEKKALSAFRGGTAHA